MFTESRLTVYLGDAPVTDWPTPPPTLRDNTTNMADDKENIADGLMTNISFQAPMSVLSPKKTARKTRSKSIGPGGLGEQDAPPLKESNGNRRKSAFIPAVKSILSSNDEDEKKRREARRKSLGISHSNPALAMLADPPKQDDASLSPLRRRCILGTLSSTCATRPARLRPLTPQEGLRASPKPPLQHRLHPPRTHPNRLQHPQSRLKSLSPNPDRPQRISAHSTKRRTVEALEYHP
jgi:kinetochore protein Spc7/SPC105